MLRVRVVFRFSAWVRFRLALGLGLGLLLD